MVGFPVEDILANERYLPMGVDMLPASIYNTARFCPSGMCWGNRLYPGFPG
jgi:hypothetical protein